MRFDIHHEGADYDNPEEVLITDTHTNTEVKIRSSKHGFMWEMHGSDGATSWGVIPCPPGDDQ